MPKHPGASKKALSENIAEERKAGRPEAQAVAIGLSEQRAARKRKKSGKNGRRYAR
jgi:hypothetical protein